MYGPHALLILTHTFGAIMILWITYWLCGKIDQLQDKYETVRQLAIWASEKNEQHEAEKKERKTLSFPPGEYVMVKCEYVDYSTFLKKTRGQIPLTREDYYKTHSDIYHLVYREIEGSTKYQIIHRLKDGDIQVKVKITSKPNFNNLK